MHIWHAKCFTGDADAEVATLGRVGAVHVDGTVADVSSVHKITTNHSWAVSGAWVCDVKAARVAVHKKGFGAA